MPAKARLIDWEIASVDYRVEGLLMAPAFAIPRMAWVMSHRHSHSLTPVT